MSDRNASASAFGWDFPEHQLIVASIYDYDLKDKKMIEFKGRLFSSTDIMTVS